MTMNSAPDHLDDEVLSALLDGPAAGSAPDDDAFVNAAAHLRACDRCSGRQGELAAARTVLVAAPVGPVDELTRRRLVAAALTAGAESGAREPAAARSPDRSRWLARHPALIGSAAAVIMALLVGVPFVIGDDNPAGEAGTTLAAGVPEGSQELSGTFLWDLGDLSDRENLRQRLATRRVDDTYATPPMEPGASPAAGSPVAAPAPSAVPSGGGLASTTTVAGYQSAPMAASGRSSGASGAGTAEKAAGGASADVATSNSEAAALDQAAGRDRADTDACVAALLNGPAAGGRLEAAGTGSFEGRPAIVAVFEVSGGRVAFVADRAGCAVLDRFAV